MASFSPKPPDAPSANCALAGLVENLADLLAHGRRQDVDLFLDEHPEQSERLRELLPAMALLAQAGRGEPSDSSGEAVPASTGSLLGDFRIVREVGRGGMGIVYEAEQISLSRRVALKVLPLAGMLDPRHLQRFGNEAKAAAGLHHQNIVPVYAVGCDRGVHYYAMQFIEGRTLAQVVSELRVFRAAPHQSAIASVSGAGRLAQGDTFSERPTMTLAGHSTVASRPEPEFFRTVAQWGVQIAGALEYAHGVGVIHRDVKPANLLLDSQGKIWITDFGLAQIEADAGLTMTGGVVGTVRYMSPEQAGGERGLVDQRSDVYSLGVTLYELLSLVPAIDAPDRNAVAHRTLDQEVPSLRQHDPRIPRELETIILKAARATPGERYATAQDLADDLQRFLDHRPIHARPPTVSERLSKWSRRNRSLVRAGTLLALMGSIGTAIALARIGQERQRADFERKLREHQEDRSRAGERSLRQNQYVLEIALAALAWEESRIDSAVQHLRKCLPATGEADLRGVEWRYLWSLCRAAPAILGRHNAPVTHACFSPNGRLLATAGVDGVQIWDYHASRQIARLRDHSPAPTRLKFSPDGRWLATTGLDQTALIWDAQTWTIRHTIRMPHVVIGVEFVPDGSYLTVAEALPGWREAGSDELVCRVTLFDPETWEVAGTLGPFPRLSAAAFSTDSRTMAMIAGHRLRVFDWQSKQEIDTSGARATDVAFSPTQPLLVTDSGIDLRMYYLNDMSRRTPDTFAGHRDMVVSVHFATDGRLISTSKDGTAKIWEFRSDQVDRPFQTMAFRHEGIVWTAIAAPDCKSLVTAAADGVVRRWDLVNPPGQRRLIDSALIPESLRFTSSGDALLVGKDGNHIVDPWTGAMRPAEPGFSVADSTPCGRFHVESQGSSHQVIETSTGELKLNVQGPGKLVFSPDCTSLAFGPRSNVIRIWRCDDWTEMIAFPAGPGTTTALCWGPDDRTLAVASDRGTVKLWNVATGRELLTLADDMETALDLAYSPESGFLAACGRAPRNTGDLRIWRLDPQAAAVRQE